MRREGVISNFEVAEEMISYFLRKAREGIRYSRPRIVIGVPSGVTNVERRAAKDAAIDPSKSIGFVGSKNGLFGPKRCVFR